MTGAWEHEDPAKASDLWVKIARWYGDHISHLEYAVHSAQAALRLDPKHVGALSALADFHRKRGAFGEQAWAAHSIKSLSNSARICRRFGLTSALSFQ